MKRRRAIQYMSNPKMYSICFFLFLSCTFRVSLVFFPVYHRMSKPIGSLQYSFSSLIYRIDEQSIVKTCVHPCVVFRFLLSTSQIADLSIRRISIHRNHCDRFIECLKINSTVEFRSIEYFAFSLLVISIFTMQSVSRQQNQFFCLWLVDRIREHWPELCINDFQLSQRSA